ncbi:carrier with solute carrier repeats [Schizosaccharomyces cryophilus OY26]|uniref:Carrier with solute carrier repeats n=1 Tax=Schizosaccharomyces cryophilus (strain OY26 / ATCC MYA-4695 / CBS 11777 / NBRC 106824 / NRRL Y48691) TaxID=653667 RepID=S9X444_SCHCR|nr:carrier with solute carrier repeats [Schizosaccharomyces cryophilus OY26]EPY51817.1 carrier with solute carrier repeats [Schizosaccharomyces cryophilus OY26]
MAEGTVSQSAKDFLAGASGGVAQVLVGQPFDCVKVRLQSQSIGSPLYDNVLDCVKKISKNEGVGAFYKGTVMPLLGIGFCVSIQFTTFEYAKRFFNRNGNPVPMPQYYVAGAISGLANSFLVGPVEHIRIRLQIQTGANKLYNGPLDCIKKISSQYGMKGIMKGFNPTAVREAHGLGVYFLTYEALIKHSMEKYQMKDRAEIPGWKLCAFGAACGYSMWVFAYPFDIVKSKIQTDGFLSKASYKSAWQCAKGIYASSGMMGFYRGFIPVLIRAATANAVTFYVYETVSQSVRHL